MRIKQIEERVKDLKSSVDGRLTKTAVMILIREDYNGDSKIILEKRALSLKRQPGDICFPGGRIDGDETPQNCAIRECCEELNIKEDEIKVIGEMNPFITPYGMIMYIFIGKIKVLPKYPSKAEVHRLYEISIEKLINSNPIIVEEVLTSVKPDNFPYELIYNEKEYKFSKKNINQYFYKFDDFTIWGYTARILNEFIKIIQ